MINKSLESSTLETLNDRESSSAENARPRVLLAEDDREMRRLLTSALRQDGYEVVEAGSGLQMFDILRRSGKDERPPDLVVSDIRMPGLSGLEVLNTIRARDRDLPVILITAFGDEETRQEAVQLGATAFFSKPFEVDDLRTAAMYFLERVPRSSKAKNELAEAYANLKKPIEELED